jgi:hypothetical protein
MAISRVNLVTLATGTNTGWTCAIPAGVQDGDVAFVFLAKRAATAPSTVPTGYTLLDPVDVSGGSLVFLWCYAKVLAASDGGTNHVWAWASTTGGASCLILRGVDTGQLLDVTDPATATTTNNVTVTTPAISPTTPSAGDWALWPTATSANVTHSFVATNNGYTVTREVGATAGANGLAWAHYAAAGPVTAFTVTLSATGRTLAKTLMVKASPWNTATAQRWTGSAWTPATAQRWSGSAWVPATVQRRG